MTFEIAQRLSAFLAADGIAHTISVGRHDHLAPTSPTAFPGIHCRVDLGFPRRHALQLQEVGIAVPDRPLSAVITRLEEIGGELDLVLETGLMGDGLTFSTRPKERR